MKFGFISDLRVISMIMVVLYHCFCFYTPIWNVNGAIKVDEFYVIDKFINSIAMPVFFCISGFLYMKGVLNKKKDVSQFAISKLKRLFIPFIFWGIFVCVFLSHKSLGNFFLYGASHLWFLGTLFLIFCLVLFKKHWPRYTSKRIDIILLIVFLCISCISVKIPQNPGFVIYQALSYFYTFWIGIMLAKYAFTCNHVNLFICLLSCVSIFIVSLSPEHFVEISLRKISVCFFLFAILSWGLSKDRESSLFPAILDKYSMGIYIIHHIILQFMLKDSSFVFYLNHNLYAPIILCPIFVFVSLLCAYGLKKIPIVCNIIGW